MKLKTTVGRKLSVLLATAVAATALAAIAGPASALAAPVLKAEIDHTRNAEGAPLGSHIGYDVTISNTGDATANAPISVKVTVPAGLTIVNTVSPTAFNGLVTLWTCNTDPGKQSATCTGPTLGLPGPGEEACKSFTGVHCRIVFIAKVDNSLTVGDTVTPTVEACGGGAVACATGEDPTPVEPARKFEATFFDGNVLKEDGEPATQAGGHPWTAYTNIAMQKTLMAGRYYVPTDELRNTAVDLPPGLVGNPNVVGTCTASQIIGGNAVDECPNDSQVGVIKLVLGFGSEAATTRIPLYSMNRLPGQAATFAFNIAGSVVDISFSVRSGTDYGIHTEVLNNPLTLPIGGIELTFRGIPADPKWDQVRGHCMTQAGLPGGPSGGCPITTIPVKSFLTLPTSCPGVPAETFLRVTSWENTEATRSFLSHDNTPGEPQPTATQGCNTLKFTPSLEARPTTNIADASTGLDVDIHVPQNADPVGTATPHLRKAVVQLPEGLSVNPSGANGLGSCSQVQVGVTSPTDALPVQFTPAPAQCPSNSKLGRVEIDTPLLDHPMLGGLYLAEPHANPFGSLLALYIMVYDAESGVNIKLAGEVQLDPATGRLTATFEENPQLPFEDLKINIAGGATAPLRTPAICGNYSTTSSLTPWSAPDSGPAATPSDSYGIQQPAGGTGTCPASEAARPNTPSFDAGTTSPIAGANSPLVVNLRRSDGSQQFASVKLSPPPGLIGKLAGIPYCTDAALATAEGKTGAEEKATPSCPAASELGNVTAGAGTGPAPYYAPGKAYLIAPYKGAPLGLAVVIPAVAGPFDLGTIVVRSSLSVDPKTAQITAVSDTIPSMLQGIPLDVRTVQIVLDRPEFIRNPTSCNPLAFTGQLVTTLGQAASLENRFQVGECGAMGFQPKLAITLSGNTKRRGHPALTAVLTTRPGDANLKSVSVAMPPSELLDNAHIGTVCTRVQFAASQCPEASRLGQATVSTPILDYDLSGPVYLRSSDNKLPDIVPDLRGPANQPIKLEAAGRTDTVKGAIRNSFESIPDAPFSKLVLTLEGGKKGLLINSKDICKKGYKATIKFGAQSGLTYEEHPKVATPKCKPQKKKKKGKKKSKGGKQRAAR